MSCVGTNTCFVCSQSQGGPFRFACFRPAATDDSHSSSGQAGDSNSQAGGSSGRAGAEEGLKPQAVIAAAADQEVQQWVVRAPADSSASLQGGDAVELLPAVRGSRVKAFDVSPNGVLAVALLWDSSLSVWNLATGRRDQVRNRSCSDSAL